MESIDDFFPLSELPEGEEAKIYHIDRGRGKGGGSGFSRQEDMVRLYALGLIPGMRVKMLISHNNCTYLIEVKGCRYGVGRGLVDKISVYKE